MIFWRLLRKPKTIVYEVSANTAVHDPVQAQRIERLEHRLTALDKRVSRAEQLLGIEVKNIVRDHLA